MDDPLQTIVDGLARRLGRAVSLDDAQFVLRVHSSTGDLDEVRRTSIMTRHTPEAARAWVRAAGVTTARKPVRVAGREDIAMAARVMCPIRWRGLLLGYLGVLEPLDDEDLQAIAHAADAAGQVLYREQLLSDLRLAHERELVRNLLSADDELRREAAYQLLEAGLVRPRQGVVVLAVQPVHTGRGVIDEEVRLAIGMALDQVRRSLPPGEALHLLRPDHGVFVTAPGMLDASPTAVAERLRSALADALPVNGWSAQVGMGDPESLLDRAHLSYRQARHALRVGVLRRSDAVNAWSDLGVYRTLVHFPVEQLAVSDVHPGLARLLALEGSDVLVETLDTYLSLGCDAMATASALCVHRASLYYRLKKIEEITGTSVRSGEDRLAVHLGLKLLQLGGCRQA